MRTRTGIEEEDKGKGQRKGRTRDDTKARQGTRVSMSLKMMRDNNELQ